MRTISSRDLKNRAAAISKNSPEFRKAVRIHSAIALAAPLAVFLLQLLLSLAAPKQSGLAGFQSAAMFSTAQSFLNTVCQILLPFWQIGVLFAAIRATRRQEVDFSDLKQGFRRWGVVLRYQILISFGSMAVVFVAAMGLSLVLSFLMPIYMSLRPMPESASTLSTEAFLQSFESAVSSADPVAIIRLIPKDIILYTLPILILASVCAVILILHIYYRLRMSQFLLMDDPAVGARQSIFYSNQMVKGNKWKLFLLDLSFWWYGLLQLLPAAVSILPLVLSYCKISLPIPGTVVTLLSQLLSTGIHMGILWFFGPYINATYACAYDELRTPSQAITTQDYYPPQS